MQLVLHCCTPRQIVRVARCSHALFAAANESFAWLRVPIQRLEAGNDENPLPVQACAPLSFHHHAHWCLIRHLPLALTWCLPSHAAACTDLPAAVLEFQALLDRFASNRRNVRELAIRDPSQQSWRIREEEWTQILTHPCLQSVHRLVLFEETDPSTAGDLVIALVARHLLRLESFHLYQPSVQVAAASSFARDPHTFLVPTPMPDLAGFRALRHLELFRPRMGGTAWRKLFVEHPFPAASLQSLTINGQEGPARLSDADAMAVLTGLASLTHLTLKQQPHIDECLTWLPHSRSLMHLVIDVEFGFGQAAFPSIASLSALLHAMPELRVLVDMKPTTRLLVSDVHMSVVYAREEREASPLLSDAIKAGRLQITKF